MFKFNIYRYARWSLLNSDTRPVGVEVVIVAAGSVRTAIWDKAEALPSDHLKGTIWERPFRTFIKWMIANGRRGLTPEDVGEVIVKALTAAKPKVRYPAVKGELANSTLPPLLPRRWVDRAIG